MLFLLATHIQTTLEFAQVFVSALRELNQFLAMKDVNEAWR